MIILPWLQNYLKRRGRGMDGVVVTTQKRLWLKYKDVIFKKSVSQEEEENKERVKAPEKEEEKSLNKEEEKSKHKEEEEEKKDQDEDEG